MTSRVDIPAWITSRRASDDPGSRRGDEPECPHTSTIVERPDTSSLQSYKEGSEEKL
jgi:hypothetical protein